MRKLALLGVALATFMSVGALNSPSASAQGIGIGVGPGGVGVRVGDDRRGYRDRGYRRSYGEFRRGDRFRRDRGRVIVRERTIIR